jgi:hypothetical protein
MNLVWSITHPANTCLYLTLWVSVWISHEAQFPFCEIHTTLYPKVSGLAALERDLRMVQLSVTRCSCIAILWVSLVSFAAITLYVASQRVFVVYFVIDSVRKILDTPSYPRLWLYYKYTEQIRTEFREDESYFRGRKTLWAPAIDRMLFVRFQNRNITSLNREYLIH